MVLFPHPSLSSSLQRNLLWQFIMLKKQICDIEWGRTPSPAELSSAQTERHFRVLFSSGCLFPGNQNSAPCSAWSRQGQRISPCHMQSCVFVGKCPQIERFMRLLNKSKGDSELLFNPASLLATFSSSRSWETLPCGATHDSFQDSQSH